MKNSYIPSDSIPLNFWVKKEKNLLRKLFCLEFFFPICFFKTIFKIEVQLIC